jgi:hypothetical protein
MSMRGKLGRINRAVAAVLALAWACTGIGALVALYVSGRWVLALAALFSLWYATLWARVAARARLLTWSEIATPWRAR